jgi:hypothetical protein
VGLEPATAAARWRPNGDGVRVASSGDARKGEEQKWRRQRATRGRGNQQEVVLGARYRRRAAVAGAAQRGKRRAPEEDEAGDVRGTCS